MNLRLFLSFSGQKGTTKTMARLFEVMAFFNISYDSEQMQWIHF